MQWIKKLTCLVLSGILALSLSACSTVNEEEEQKKFDEFIQQQFVETMENDYVTRHTLLENPQDYHIDMKKTEVSLGTTINEENIKKEKETLDTTWKEFKKFHRKSLTKDQQDTYDIYEFQTGIDVKSTDDIFDNYQQLYGSMTGIHYQLPTLFSDWTLRNEQDVKDVIVLMKDVKPYIDSTISYTTKQAELGLLMTSLEDVKEYTDGIIKDIQENKENCSILSSMYANIDALALDAKQTNLYKEQLKEAVFSSFLPAYEAISQMTIDLKDKNQTEGLAKLEHGKEYYELLLQSNIGSMKTVDQVKTMASNAFQQHIQKMQSLLMQNTDALGKIMQNDIPSTKFKSYKEILDMIRGKLSDDFPTVSHLEYNIKDMPTALASNSGVAAYFNIPSIDGNEVKQLRVNPKTADITNIETYRTVAHEGFPGHMYQYGYMYETIDSPWRKTLANSLAYTEGYAVYAQNYAMKYLDVSKEDQIVYQLVAENEIASYYAIILADIGIHYEGWSLEDFKNNLKSMGLALDDDQAIIQYNQLQANPAAFAAYYIGYEEINQLKEKAMKELGDQFDDKAFHTALLKSGNAPFSVVERNIQAYIKGE